LVVGQGGGFGIWSLFEEQTNCKIIFSAVGNQDQQPATIV